MQDLLKSGYYGIPYELIDEKNWQLCAGTLELPKPRFTFKDKEIEYAQNEVSKVSCTIHGSGGSMSDQTGLKLTLEDRKTMWEMAKARPVRPATEENGWWTTLAIDLVRDYVNEKYFKDDKLATYSFQLDSPEFWQAMDLGYTATVGFKGNSSWSKDKNADGVLDKIYTTDFTYAHCVRMMKLSDETMQLVIDNYPDTSRKNRYKIPIANFKKMVASGTFHTLGYVFAFKKDVEALANKPKYPIWAVNSIEKCIKKGVAKQWDNPDEIIADGTTEQMLINLGVLSSQNGNLSKARFAVALDRLGLLD